MIELSKQLFSSITENSGAGYTVQTNYNEFEVDIPSHSPWSTLIAYHATRGEAHKINRIKEYLSLKADKDQGHSFDEERFSTLKGEVSSEYFASTQAFAVEGQEVDVNAKIDYADRLKGLTSYLSDLVHHSKNAEGKHHKALKEPMQRTNDANRRRRDYVMALKEDLRNGVKFWDDQDPNIKGGEYLEQGLPDILQKSLGEIQGLTNNAIRLGNAMSGKSDKDARALGQEYIDSMNNILEGLWVENDREDLNLIDLMYYVAEHRGATTFRESTAGYYEDYEAFSAALNHMMPSLEKQREDVDLIHNCVDPRFIELSHTLKLSYLNQKHSLGLDEKDVDLYGTVTGMIGSVMRGYGIEEIDDRYKQYLHNSGDHSLRVCITIASTRDTNIARFKGMRENGEISADEMERQIELANESATYFSKLACLHDTGEFLGELLGNNLVGRTEKEESVLRRLRDQVEQHIMDEVVPQELQVRLQEGAFSDRWEGVDVKQYIRSSLKGDDDQYQYGTSFYEAVFDCYERLQTQHDITAQRSVGRINQEGRYENARTMSDDDRRYTLQYVHSKITGHKFSTVDPVDIAQHHEEKYEQARSLEDYEISNKVATHTGAHLPYEPDVTRIKDLPHTDLPLDVFMDERDVDFDKSLFKKMVGQIVEDHQDPTLEGGEASARQFHNEALVHGICYEMNHMLRKHARAGGLDHHLVDKASRKSIAQATIYSKGALEKEGLGLSYLQEPNMVLGKERYRVASINTSKFMGGLFGDPNKPNQLFEPLQGLGSIISNVFNKLNDNVFSPLFKAAKTPFQALSLIDNDHVTQKDFKRLLYRASVLEAGGDAGFAITGLAETSSNEGGGFDTKLLSTINPLITWALAKPQRHAEAIEKCYGHVLDQFGDQVAEKYGLTEENDMERVVGYLKTRENLKKGPYHKKPTDITMSGDLSQKMYDYFEQQYGGAQVENGQSNLENSEIKAIERAERYFLKELMNKQIAKTTNRLLQGVSPAQNKAWQNRVNTLLDAKDQLGAFASLKNSENRTVPQVASSVGQAIGDVSFNLRMKRNSEIRFGSIALLGTGLAFSTTGADIVGPITTSTVMGANLAVAGGSALLASVSDKMADVPHSNLMRKMENLPYFEKGHKGGLYIVKGATHTLEGSTHEDTESLVEDLLKRKDRSPNMLVQLYDTALAVPVTAVRALSNRRTSGTAFGNQNAALTVDAGGGVYRAFDGVVNGVTSAANAGQKAVGAAMTTTFFRRLGVLNMYMHEIQEDLKVGRDPDYESIQKRVRDEIREDCNPQMLNLFENIGRRSEGTAIGKVGSAVEAVAFNDALGKVTHGYLDWRDGVNTRDLD